MKEAIIQHLKNAADVLSAIAKDIFFVICGSIIAVMFCTQSFEREALRMGVAKLDSKSGEFVWLYQEPDPELTVAPAKPVAETKPFKRSAAGIFLNTKAPKIQEKP